jgi:hypothetical protein
MQRMMHRFPKQGDREPWINPQNYSRDKKMIRFGALEDGALIAGRHDSDVFPPSCRFRVGRRSPLVETPSAPAR